MPETGHLERVHDAVVSVCAIADLEARCAVRLELVLRELDDSRVVARKVTLRPKERRIGEEDVRFTRCKWALYHRNDLVWRPLQEFISNGELPLLLSHASCDQWLLHRLHPLLRCSLILSIIL